MAFYTDLGYIERIPWTDGTEVFCKRCDAKVPMSVRDNMLVCARGHATHPAQGIVSGEMAR